MRPARTVKTEARKKRNRTRRTRSRAASGDSGVLYDMGDVYLEIQRVRVGNRGAVTYPYSFVALFTYLPRVGKELGTIIGEGWATPLRLFRTKKTENKMLE